MEKKNYLKPEMKVFDMKVEGMLCDSGDGIETQAKPRSLFDTEVDDN